MTTAPRGADVSTFLFVAAMHRATAAARAPAPALVGIDSRNLRNNRVYFLFEVFDKFEVGSNGGRDDAFAFVF